jgi:hypothetical protein
MKKSSEQRKRAGQKAQDRDLERPRVRFTLTPGIRAALDVLPKGKHDPVRDENLFLRYALAEGICALADYYEKTGRVLVPFRFEVQPSQPLRSVEYEERAAREEQTLMKWLLTAFGDRLAEEFPEKKPPA